MPILNVNPTRNELLKLKRRLKSVARGHKLLKDKQDGLMQEFLKIVQEARSLRTEVEELLGDAFMRQILASSAVFPQLIAAALAIPTMRAALSVSEKNVMSVRVPEFEIQTEGDALRYGYAFTSGEMDAALRAFSEALPKMLQLSAVEKAAENMAWEIEATRRRVNALEHRVIPDVQDTIKFIKMKLDETERAGIITTMMLKAREEEAARTEGSTVLAEM